VNTYFIKNIFKYIDLTIILSGLLLVTKGNFKNINYASIMI